MKEKFDQHQIVTSLSGDDDRIISYLPYLLQDLSSLGSNQEILIYIIDKNISLLNRTRNVLDLCCGKGTSLISIVEKYNWKGKGIDLFQPFIAEARSIAEKKNLMNIEFEIMDIRDAINVYINFDLILYGSDALCLGEETEALRKISRCLNPNGFIIYETAFEKDLLLEEMIKVSGFNVIDKIDHHPENVKAINTFNTSKIRNRADELKAKNPGLEKLFDDYVKLQEEECRELEAKYIFATFLLSIS